MSESPAPPSRPGFFKITLYVLLMGVLVSWVAFWATPVAIRWEIPQPMVDRIPIAGLFLGAALGLAMGFLQGLREFVWAVLGTIIAGLLLWFSIVTGLGLGVTLVLDGEEFDQTMDKISTFTGWLIGAAGAVATVFIAYAFAQEKSQGILNRLRPKRRKVR
jgi:hypothetical protein